jgi:hypothetical protein
MATSGALSVTITWGTGVLWAKKAHKHPTMHRMAPNYLAQTSKMARLKNLDLRQTLL